MQKTQFSRKIGGFPSADFAGALKKQTFLTPPRVAGCAFGNVWGTRAPGATNGPVNAFGHLREYRKGPPLRDKASGFKQVINTNNDKLSSTPAAPG
jgi:hypothetical protein